MSEPALVRPATPADAADIAHIHVTTWQQAYDGLLPAALLDSLSLEQRTAYWTDFLAAVPADSAVAVAEVDERVVGFVGTCPSRDEDADPATTGEVAAIYLLRPWWDRGIGAQLLVAGEEAVAASGRTEATLWVLADNERARAAYERHGWIADGATRVEDLHGRLVTEVRYWRSLGSDDASD